MAIPGTGVVVDVERRGDHPAGDTERAILARILRSEKSEFVAVYGRRRVGKTFLIRRFFEREPVVYFEMMGRFQGTLEGHLRIFAESLSRVYYSGANLVPPKNWHDGFRLLQDAIERRRGKLVVVWNPRCRLQPVAIGGQREVHATVLSRPIPV
ncbi:MAG: hypothetical protein MJE77_07375 [Proteobacteria bacterium]|nr:hypothetical protein [Pseudomonadota bacterium]